MRHLALAATLLATLAAAPAWADKNKSLCPTCGVVQSVQQEKRDGQGGALGMVGGAVVGGLLGNQVGGGTGKTLATIGGAVGGAYVGNEVQKKATSQKVWVTRVRMKDGGERQFEQVAAPAWKAGQMVRVNDKGVPVLLP